MEQTTTTLSAPSRMTSSSYSFQPSTDRSTRISPTGLAASPRAATSRSSDSSRAKPVPPPPRMNDGRTMIGKPTTRPTAIASSTP